MEATPITCAICRCEVPVRSTVFVLDRTMVGFGLMSSGTTPDGSDFTVEANDPKTLCSKPCVRKALAKM